MNTGMKRTPENNYNCMHQEPDIQEPEPTIETRCFKVTPNGFVKVWGSGIYQLFFYHAGDEKYWLDAGYKQIV